MNNVQATQKPEAQSEVKNATAKKVQPWKAAWVAEKATEGIEYGEKKGGKIIVGTFVEENGAKLLFKPDVIHKDVKKVQPWKEAWVLQKPAAGIEYGEEKGKDIIVDGGHGNDGVGTFVNENGLNLFRPDVIHEGVKDEKNGE